MVNLAKLILTLLNPGLNGHEAKDIWNTNETGCFWIACSDRGFAHKKAEPESLFMVPPRRNRQPIQQHYFFNLLTPLQNYNLLTLEFIIINCYDL